MTSQDDDDNSSSDVQNERSDDASEEEGKVDPSTYLINVLKRFEERGVPLSQIILSKKTTPTDNRNDIDNSDVATEVPSLQVQTLISLIDNAPIGEGVESEDVIKETCSYLIHILQDIYQQQQQHDNDNQLLLSNTACMDALCNAYTTRLKYLPILLQNDTRHNFDKCNPTTILNPPDTTSNQLSRLLVEIEDHYKHLKSMSKLTRDFLKLAYEGVLPRVDQLREKTLNNVENNDEEFPLETIDHIMLPIANEYSFEECYDAVFLSNPRKKLDYYTPDELIGEYADAVHATDNHKENPAMKICVFVGIVRGLEEHKRYHTEQNIDKCLGKECNGHGNYEEAEPESVHGWYSSWTEESDKPKKNSFYYGIKVGALLEYSNEYAKEIADLPPKGTELSSPRARFCQDMAESKQAADGGTTTAEDIAICRARHSHVESDAFHGDDSTVYSTMMWKHDGQIGFSHVGTGWKNREFAGHIYSSKNGTFESHEMSHEFWSTPSSILADGMNETVWIHADQRVKGFAIDNGQACTKYIFSVLSDKIARASVTAAGGAQSKLRKVEGAGNQNMIGFGSNRFGYLSQSGILQEWKLNDANQHDGIRREVRMECLDEDIKLWDEEDILNLGDSTWMDEEGLAEVTRGKKPDSIRLTDVVTPYSIGYLADEKFAFVHNGQSEITMYDCNLQEMSRLVAFGSDKVDVVQRPTFEMAGDPSIFVASDLLCAKIFDLRSGKAEITIRQRCVNSIPVYFNDAKFVCNKLSEGKGAMMWDLRSQQPLYSLPISGNTDMVWVPSSNSHQCPLLLTGSGEYYRYGENPVRNEDDRKWEVRSAESAWSEIESKRKNDRGVSDCSIM